MKHFLNLLTLLCTTVAFGQAPTANFTASPLEICVGNTINFTDASTPGAVPITNRTWDFGDGASSNLLNPSHTYTAAGTYTITLVVTDQNGVADPEVKPAYIVVNPLPQASFSFTGNGCTVPFDVTFTNSSASGPNISYAWDFGNGQTSSLENPAAVTYTTAGTFTVSLSVTNTTTGCVNTFTDNVVVSDFAAGIDAPLSACVGSTVNVSDLSTVGANQWNWSFGNGQTSTAQNPSVTYGAVGTYTISLISENTNSGCQDTETQTITITPPPTPSFSTSTTIGCSPVTATFTNNSPGGTSYNWDFGDGTTGTGFNPGQHIYTANGTYSVTLTMVDANGCTGTTTLTNIITVTAPTVDFDLAPNEGCAPITVSFTDLSSSPNPGADPITSWLWDFGDGSTFNGQAPPPHVYSTTGVYTVTLTATTQAGCIGIESKVDTIKVGGHSIPDFTVDPPIDCAKSDFDFTNLTTFIGTPDPNHVQYMWEFGDGGTSTDENPTYQYPIDTGYFSVQLIVDWNGCQDTIEYEDLVYVKAPIARFTPSQTLFCNPSSFPVNLDVTDISIVGTVPDDVEMIWDWGDGTFTYMDDPDIDDLDAGSTSHTYSSYGTYAVEQVIFNHTTGCEDSVTNYITITETVASFTLSEDSTCFGDPVTLTNTSTSTDIITPSGLVYDMGDGSLFSQTSSVTYDHSSSGNYTLTLTTTNIFGCSDDATTTVEVLERPNASITPSATTGCVPITVTYTNSSSPVGNGVPLESFFWTMPDLTTQTLTTQTSTSHTFTTEGVFTTTLVATDEFGCVSNPALVNMTITKPTADFSLDSIFCDEEVFTALNTSTGATSYEWFVDGSSTAVTNDFNHSFNEVTNASYNHISHLITMIATDQNGCMDTVEQDVIVSLPYIDLTYTLNGASVNGAGDFTCPPVFAGFTDNSNSYGSIVSWDWDFGDGKFSSFQNPNNTYVFPGVYSSHFSIVDQYGCTADTSLTDYLTILGPSGQASWVSVGELCYESIVFNSDSLSSVSDILWTLGDGTIVNSLTPFDHIYPSYQTYNPTATLIDNAGCEILIELPPVYLINNGVNALFTSSEAEGPAGTVFTFTDYSSYTNAPIDTWTWYFPNNTITNYTGADVNQDLGPPGTYTVTLVVADTNGCSHSYSLQVTVTSEFHLPNVFTPNGDGTNEFFEMKADVFESFEIVIMNRWGNVVHKRVDATGTYLWDGLAQSGKPAVNGVYFYRLSGTLTDGTISEKHGNVTLIRGE